MLALKIYGNYQRHIILRYFNVWTLLPVSDSFFNSYLDENEAMTIRNALDIIQGVTCVRFEQISDISLTPYINVIKSDG